MMRVLTPKEPQEFEKYYHFRWQLLREPWHKARGTEQDELELEACHRMMLNDNNDVIGVARLHFESERIGVVRYVAVSDQVQGKGVGRALMDELEAEATRRGCQKIILQAREGAVNFYKKLDYQLEKKSHLLYQQIQHFQMSKQLSPLLTEQAVGLTNTWHKTIPLSQFMGIEIAANSPESLVTVCGVNQNKNLHNTMFAGSISTLATLTGWGWCFLSMKAENVDGDIVLADGQTKYYKPVTGSAFGMVNIEALEQTTDFTPLHKGLKVRVLVSVDIVCGDLLAASFKGKYVILPPKNKD